MDGIFQNALKDLTETQNDFLCEEFGMSKDELMSCEEEKLDEIYDALCDMEVDELAKCGDGEESDRCKIVGDIVTTLGNAIAEAEGYFDEDDE